MHPNKLIKLAATMAMALPAAGAMATGLVAIPTTGSTPYQVLNPTGNFGSSEAGSTAPTTSANNVGAVFPANPATSPVAGFTAVNLAAGGVTAITSALAVDNVYTRGPVGASASNPNPNSTPNPITVANVTKRLWKNAAGTQCIYGVQVSMVNNPLPYSESTTTRKVVATPLNWEINDILLGGFASAGTVNAGYYFTPRGPTSADEVIFRAGRTFTSVQHKANPSDPTGNTPAPGTLAAPPTAGAPANTTTITNVQAAAINAGYVDFTTDVNSVDPDGSSNPDAPWVYVQATGCPATSGGFPVTTTNAIRLRSTGQEGQATFEATVAGYVPSGATVLPLQAPVWLP